MFLNPLIHRTTPATVVRIRPAWERADVASAPRPRPGPVTDPDPDQQVHPGPDMQLEAA